MMDMRRLSELEKEALFALANAVGKDGEREQLISDLDHCFVEEVSPDGSRVVRVATSQRPARTRSGLGSVRSPSSA